MNFVFCIGPDSLSTQKRVKFNEYPPLQSFQPYLVQIKLEKCIIFDDTSAQSTGIW